MMVMDRCSTMTSSTCCCAFRSVMMMMVVLFSILIILLPACCNGWMLSSTKKNPPRRLVTSSSSTARTQQSSTSFTTYLLASSSSSSSSRGGAEGYGSNNGSSEEEGMRQRRRMEAVRSLQTAFYSNVTKTEMNYETGIVYNLPLWRVPWIELPGRTNVLNVHNPIYTNMFESVLHSEPPWYVGHMYMPAEQQKSSLHDPDCSNNNNHYKLVAWDEQVGGGDGESSSEGNQNDTAASPTTKSSSTIDHHLGNTAMSVSAKVLGTILRIVDYRRLVDGRLLLLVQGMERFTVLDAVQELPYGVAHVQLIPDSEEVDYDEDSNWIGTRTEGDVASARGMAISESFKRWHRYEYENTVLPLPLKEEIQPNDVVGSAVAKVLPYAPYSSVVKVEQVLKETNDDDDDDDDSPSDAISSSNDLVRRRMESADYAQNTLEHRLIQGKILHQPTSIDPALLKLSCDELEIRLWTALDRHLKKTKKAVSPVLLGFLPHDVDWDGGCTGGGADGGGFVLEQIADAIGDQTELASKFVRLPPGYPTLRRQKRLSYSIAALLEDIDTVHNFRQELLAIPSTKVRMAYILQMLLLEEEDDDEWGAFQ